LENTGINTGSQQCAKRTDKVAEKHLRHADFLAFDQGCRQRAGPEPGFLFAQGESFLSLFELAGRSDPDEKPEPIVPPGVIQEFQGNGRSTGPGANALLECLYIASDVLLTEVQQTGT
jgi:hypothetical protein